MSLIDAALAFVGGGGLTATVGTIVGGIAKYKERQLEMTHELAMLPHRQFEMNYEQRMLESQQAHDKLMIDQELMISVEKSAGVMQTAAITSDRVESVAVMGMRNMPWQVGAIRTLFRPFLTICLWFAVGIILIVDPTSTSPLMKVTVNTINNGAGMSLGLWFGSRMMTTRPIG